MQNIVEQYTVITTTKYINQPKKPVDSTLRNNKSLNCNS